MIRKLLTLLILCCTASQVFALVDLREERHSAIDVVMPWRVCAVEPTRTVLDAQARGSIVGLYSGLFDSEVVDMTAPTQRAVFTTSTAPIAGETQAAAITYLEGLTVNTDYDFHDWSGCSVGADHIVNGGAVTYSTPVTLITDRHGLASDHNEGGIGRTMIFREPDGDIVTAVVEDQDEIADGSGEISLVRFSAATAVNLVNCKRYSVASNVDDYDGGYFWALDQDFDVRLTEIDYLYYFSWFYQKSSVWTQANIVSGSGRPCFVALSNGDLLLAGNLWSSVQFPVLQSATAIADINGYLDDYSEELSLVAIPGVNSPVTDYTPAPEDPTQLSTNGHMRAGTRTKTKFRNYLNAQ